jgi:hypothetical protein
MSDVILGNLQTCRLVFTRVSKLRKFIACMNDAMPRTSVRCKGAPADSAVTIRNVRLTVSL